MEGRWHNGRKIRTDCPRNSEVEAYKLGLLESAKKLADQGITLPKQQVAGMSGLQQEAFQQAQAGIDSFKPYLQEAGYTLGDAQAAFDPSGIGAFMNPFQQAHKTKSTDLMIYKRNKRLLEPWANRADRPRLAVHEPR